MEEDYNKYIKELHERNYSVFFTSKAQEVALQELHDRSYCIFDEEEHIRLKQEYDEEYRRLSHEISFPTYQKMLRESDLFINKSDSLLKKIAKTKFKSDASHIRERKHVVGKESEFDNSLKSGQLESTNTEMADNQYSNVGALRIFHYSDTSSSDNYFDTRGYYDCATKQFILLKDSVLSLNIEGPFVFLIE